MSFRSSVSALVLVLMLLGPQVTVANDLVRVVEAERAGDCASVSAPTSISLEAVLALGRLAKCRFAEGDFAGAVDAVDSFVRAPTRLTNELRQLTWAAELEARAALHRGDNADAVARFAAALSQNAGAPRETRARLAYYLALALEAGGDERASAAWADLLHDFPGTRYSSIAQLSSLAAPTAAAAVEMADSALDGRNYAAAERLLTHAACGEDECAPRDAVRGGSTQYEASYLLGHLLYRYRREFVARSLPWFETLIDVGGSRVADSRHDYAMAVMRMGRFDEARRAWAEFLEAHPSDRRSDTARFQIAWLLLDDDRYEDAAAEFRRYLRGSPARVADAQWWMGWAQFRLGNCPKAIEAWSTLRRGRRAQQVEYWSAVCAFDEGHVDDATERWEALNEEHPLSYYGVLSARRLGRSLVFGSEDRVVPQVAPLPPDVAVSVADLGLADEARILAARQLPPGVDPNFYAMRVDASPSDWVGWRAQHSDVLGAVPTTQQAALAFQLTAPRFFEATVRHAAEVNTIPRELIWSVMRKESDFRTDAVSGSDAMGLMQVIPQTALAIADRRGVAYVDGMLFEPYHAIEFGSWYLGALNVHFGNQLPLTVVAYNAGPVVVEDWLERNGGMAHDEFVEEIPFDQARDYVRKVTEFMVEYIVACGTEELLRSETLGGLFPSQIENRTNGVVDF